MMSSVSAPNPSRVDTQPWEATRSSCPSSRGTARCAASIDRQRSAIKYLLAPVAAVGSSAAQPQVLACTVENTATEARSLAELRWEIAFEICPSSEERSVWRLVNKAACEAVYEGTTALSPHRPTEDDVDATDALPLPLLQKCSGLQRLSCKNLLQLTNIQGLPPGLKVLNLTQTAIADLSPVESCIGLRHLSADGINHGGDMAMQVARALPRLPELEWLNLKGNRLDGDCIQGLAPALQSMAQLQHLDLSWNQIGAVGARALAPALQRLTRLRHLNLGMNHLAADGLAALAPALQQLTELTELNLYSNKIGAAGAALLAPAVQKLTRLQHLNLSANDLGAKGIEALAGALQQLTGLQSLALDSNHLGVKGAHALAPALQQLTGLQRLDLMNNELCAQSGRALAPAIQRLTRLHQLRLYGNQLGAEGMKALAPSIKELRELEELALGCNRLSAEAAEALAPALRKLTGLRDLDIQISAGTAVHVESGAEAADAGADDAEPGDKTPQVPLGCLQLPEQAARGCHFTCLWGLLACTCGNPPTG